MKKLSNGERTFRDLFFVFLVPLLGFFVVLLFLRSFNGLVPFRCFALSSKGWICSPSFANFSPLFSICFPSPSSLNCLNAGGKSILCFVPAFEPGSRIYTKRKVFYLFCSECVYELNCCTWVNGNGTIPAALSKYG